MSCAALSVRDAHAAARQGWRTPRALFDVLHGVFNFTVDACASHENALLPRYWTAEYDARRQSWAGETVFCNPPFSATKSIWPKAVEAKTAVFLVPLMSVATDYGYRFPPRWLLLPRRRVQYDPPSPELRPDASLPSALAVFGDATEAQIRRVGEALECRFYG